MLRALEEIWSKNKLLDELKINAREWSWWAKVEVIERNIKIPHFKC